MLAAAVSGGGNRRWCLQTWWVRGLQGRDAGLRMGTALGVEQQGCACATLSASYRMTALLLPYICYPQGAPAGGGGVPPVVRRGDADGGTGGAGGGGGREGQRAVRCVRPAAKGLASTRAP